MYTQAAKFALAAIIAVSAGMATSSGTAQAEAVPCNTYVELGDTAYFNNCGPDTIELLIDRWPQMGKIVCLPPGLHNLGPRKDISGVWYIRIGC